MANLILFRGQMVLHHVDDTEAATNTFYSLINACGYLAIADLYTEDGSFHCSDVKVHRVFDIERLADILKKAGFRMLNTILVLK